MELNSGRQAGDRGLGFRADERHYTGIPNGWRPSWPPWDASDGAAIIIALHLSARRASDTVANA